MNEKRSAFQFPGCRVSAFVIVLIALTIHQISFAQPSNIFWLHSGFTTNRAGEVAFTTNQSANSDGHLIPDVAKREVINNLFSLYDNPTNGTFTITVALNTNTYRVGDKITATVALKNVGKGRQLVSELKNDGDFLLVVENENRRAVPLAPRGRIHLGGGTWSTMLVGLEAGKTKERSYRLDELFDLKEPGDYTLRVFRQKPPETYPIAVQPIPHGMKLIEGEPVVFKLTLP